MKAKLFMILNLLTIIIPLIINNKDAILRHAGKNKVVGKLSKGLPYVVEYGEDIVKNLKTLKKG